MTAAEMPLRARELEIDSEPIALGYGGLSSGCFGRDVRHFRVVGVRGVAAPAPCEVVQALCAADQDWREANPVSVPELWPDEPPEVPGIWCLERAHVFGGRIRDRGHGFHYEGQLLMTVNGGLLPCSRGVMDGNHTLAGDLLAHDGTTWTVVNPPDSARQLAGTYVLIGNVHHHFGHSILEGLSRAWAVPYLSAELRRAASFLVYEPEIREFSRRLLERAGIPPGRIVHASPWDVVERLVVPDCAMRTHRWITSAQADVWRTVAMPPKSPPTRRVFLSRAGVKHRQVVNHSQVEDLFRQSGWEVVSPELLSIDDQVRLASQARSLAGCVGSQMYLSCFQPPGGANIVIAPRNFFLRDDVLISASVGHALRVGFGDMVDFAQPRETRTWCADLDVVKDLLTGVR
jgi:capsular polysaccharide biosynthesis protein